MVLIIWTDWNGDKYTFCGRLCLEMYRRYLADPTMKHMLSVFLPTFSCWWCGGDIGDTVKWHEDHDDSGIVQLEEEHGEDPREPA